jgi:nucleoside-diphosphate-sugar epimerase
LGQKDARDGGQACRKAIEKAYTGHHVYIIANDDTVFHRPTAELVKEHFGSVKWNGSEMEHGTFKGNEGLLGNALARKELGFEPQYTWRK